MKYRIICDYCTEEHYFTEAGKRPSHCSRCHSPLEHLEMEQVEDDDVQLLLNGLDLVYVSSGEKIELEHSEIIILGRQASGGDVLGKIPQISREHCKIEYHGGQYLLTDLNSLNGTYYGSSHRDCRKHQQVPLQDGNLLCLGREKFRIHLKYRKADQSEVLASSDDAEIIPELVYKCRACGKIHSMNLSICDECGTYGQLEPIEKKSLNK